jgi:hypothetical protein
MEITIEKRKRGRPRKVTTNEMVLVQPKSVIKQKEIEDKIREIKDILDDHKIRHKKEMEIFYGRVEKLKSKLELDYDIIVDHYQKQLDSLTTQVIKEKTRVYQMGMIFLSGNSFGIITKEVDNLSDDYFDTHYIKFKNIILSGIGNKTSYLWLDTTKKIEVLCHISKFKERCEEYGLKPLFNKNTCTLLYERMYGRRINEGEFQYSLLEHYGLVTK